MIRVLILFFFVSLSAASVLPEVTSYAKVSRNGQRGMEADRETSPWIPGVFFQNGETNGEENEGRSGKNFPVVASPVYVPPETPKSQDVEPIDLAVDERAFSRSSGGKNGENEGRGIKNIAITVSPVYVPRKIPKLQNGEAIDYSPGGRYSTLDHELLANLDASGKKQIQDRYHPQPFLTKNNGQSNGVREQSVPKVVVGPSGPSNSDSFDFSQPTYPGNFDYKPPDYLSDKPVSKPITIDDYLSDKPVSKPITIDDYPNSEINDKPPDSYRPQSDSYYGNHGQDHDHDHDHDNGHDHDPDFSDFPPDSSYHGDGPPKPIEFAGHLDHPPYSDDSYDHDHGYHHEVIYDHIPDYHDHPHDQTEPPEMNDQRLDKRPYSYYFIGKKLWYVPLYFSIYFIIYIAALVLKSVARHKINFPSHLVDAVGHSRKTPDTSWWDLTGRVLEGIENFAETFGRVS